MYECAICHSKVKIPSLLCLAVPTVKNKGLTIEYKLTKRNICKTCAKELLDSMYIDDEAEMTEPVSICEPEVPWVDDECFTCPYYAHVYHECTVGGCEYAVNPWVDDDTLPNEDMRPDNEVIG